MKATGCLVFLALLIFYSTGVFGQAISEEAKKHFDRGIAAVEDAKSPEDYDSAIKEFQEAHTLAPGWPDALYNLGMVQEKAGKYGEAIVSLRLYLCLAPDASDVETVKSLINKLEYKTEKETGFKKVYDMMLMKTDHLHWIKISRKGDNEPDWEIEHNNDFDGYRNGAIFKMEGGTLYKNDYDVRPMKGSFLMPRFDQSKCAIKVNGKFFEYRYPTFDNLVEEYEKDGSAIYDYRTSGELSIKGEIISVDPPRVKREQRVKWPDGKTSVTEFIYELQKN
jgi:hypothetical protein